MALEQFYEEHDDEIDDTDNWNVDDFGYIVHESDWVFIMYFRHLDVERKIVGCQEGFMTALDEYDPANLITDKLEIISGKEWLNRK
ncbi:hypothetical protein GIX45_03325 [Erwinia sp. CPCC 100877]|nr:hypothetical protein [Erwinia sp. CPCC 100877]